MQKIIDDPNHTESPLLVRSRRGAATPSQSAQNLEQERPLNIHAEGRCPRQRCGEAAEAAFVARAKFLGFSVLIPWGNSDRYDSAVDSGHGLLRIQVKSASSVRDSGYRVKTTGSDGHVYTIVDIDFLAGYVVPENIWYIIPVEALGKRECIYFYPHTRRGLKPAFEKYREAWCLLDCSPKARGWKDIPVVCRSKEVGVRCAVCPSRK
ncbi:MAG: group I intron-associated PD-(D/E)XK endonuclease [Candidatus Sulfotelmatobacter sp.]